jgi:uncharacterized protein (DUF427 family)
VFAPEPFVEPSPRHVRVQLDDLTVADTHRALLLSWYGPGMLPTYAIPPDDVQVELLRPSTVADGLPHASSHDVVGDRAVPGAAFRFEDPPPPIDAVASHWTFAWDTGLAWYEEALEVHVHARDPHKRVDAVPSDRHVRVELDGVVLAESRRPLAVFETTLPTRWYLPFEDVHTERLVASDTATRCPYKGTAAYWSAQTGDTLHRDLAWSYAEPVIECPRIAGLVAFFGERVDLWVDGELVPRPDTPWSQPDG